MDYKQKATARQLKQGVPAQPPPPWLHSFIGCENYLSDCNLSCKRGRVEQEPGEVLTKSHLRRYFCTDCPEEGAICLGRVIDVHLNHGVLRVRKVPGVDCPVIKVRDIDFLLNVSYVLRQLSTNDDIAYLKLKSYRQTAWGAGSKSEQVPCFECLRLDHSEDRVKYKYCSINCAYADVVNTSARTSRVQNIQRSREFRRSKSCMSGFGLRKQRATAMYTNLAQEAPPPSSPEKPTSAYSSSYQKRKPSPVSRLTSSGSLPRPSIITSSWRSRLSKYLSFGSSKKPSAQKEKVTKKLVQRDRKANISPSRTSSHDEERNGSLDKFEIPRLKSVNVREENPRGYKESTPNQPRGEDSTVRVRTPGTPFRIHKVMGPESPSNSTEGGDSRASSQKFDDWWSAKSTSPYATPVSQRMDDLNIKSAGPVIKSVYWQTEQDSDSEEEEVQEKWGAIRSHVLNRPGMAYASYAFDDGSNNSSTDTVEVVVSGFQRPISGSAKVSPENAVYACDRSSPLVGFAAINDSSGQTAGTRRMFRHNDSIMRRRKAL